jgi:hypothetical protein
LIGGLLALLLVMELVLPKPVQWQKTLSSDDKIPYGTYILKESLSSKNLQAPTVSRETFYEIPDSLSKDVMVLAPVFETDKEDVKALLSYVEAGNDVIIASDIFQGPLADTLNLYVIDVLQEEFEQTGNPMGEDSSFISWQGKSYFYRVQDNNMVFSPPDSAWVIHAKHETGDPTVISRNIGKGSLILVSNPWIFTNFYILNGNIGIVNQLLGMISSPLIWTEFYSRGRGEARTPLRYILSVPALRWVYYLLLGGVLLFVLFEIKRRQRPIPVITPPSNDSLHFSRTLGNLYFDNGNHKKIAKKMIAFLYESIRTKYYLSTVEIDDDFISKLTHKSGRPSVNVNGLFVLIRLIESKNQIDEGELKALNNKIDAFIKG